MPSYLSADDLDYLTPVLGSLARLVGNGTQLSEKQFRILVRAVGLEDNEDALKEVRIWADLLKELHKHPDEASRRTTGEALKLRGLPEAPVYLAVAAVADADRASVPGSPQPQRLSASVSRLDLGVLPPGQEVTAELEVSGGPGMVEVESDQLEVIPAEFGDSNTRILVTVKPLSSGLLWTAIKLISAEETLNVPLIAQWQETQTPRLHRH